MLHDYHKDTNHQPQCTSQGMQICKIAFTLHQIDTNYTCSTWMVCGAKSSVTICNMRLHNFSCTGYDFFGSESYTNYIGYACYSTTVWWSLVKNFYHAVLMENILSHIIQIHDFRWCFIITQILWVQRIRHINEPCCQQVCVHSNVFPSQARVPKMYVDVMWNTQIEQVIDHIQCYRTCPRRRYAHTTRGQAINKTITMMYCSVDRSCW